MQNSVPYTLLPFKENQVTTHLFILAENVFARIHEKLILLERNWMAGDRIWRKTFRQSFCKVK